MKETRDKTHNGEMVDYVCIYRRVCMYARVRAVSPGLRCYFTGFL